MRPRWIVIALLAGAAIPQTMTEAEAAATAAELPAVAGPGLPVTPQRALGVTVSEDDFAAFTPAGRPARARWRVVQGTGNRAENYIAATAGGRLVDVGGRDVHFSDDRGQTWWSLPPRTLALRVVGNEGAVAVAPNGDILAAVWEPDDFTAPNPGKPRIPTPNKLETLHTYKYDASTDKWSWAMAPIHYPRFDRPWLAIIPGPLRLPGELSSVPYLAVLRANSAWTNFHNEAWLYSVDGLHYAPMGSKRIDAFLHGQSSHQIGPVADSARDWSQPQTHSFISPLAGGGAVAMLTPRDHLQVVDEPSPRELRDFFINEPGTLTWKKWAFPNLASDWQDVRLQTDSRGWLHAARLPYSNQLPTTSLVEFAEGAICGEPCWYETPVTDHVFFATSSDGGSTWHEIKLELPGGSRLPLAFSPAIAPQLDFRANGEMGVAALAVRVGDEHGYSRHYLYRIDISERKPRVDRVFEVGDGDLDENSDIASFDFPSVAILPNGAFATSFSDRTRYRCEVSNPCFEAPYSSIAILLDDGAREKPRLEFLGDTPVAGDYSDSVPLGSRLTSSAGPLPAGGPIRYELRRGETVRQTWQAESDSAGVSTVEARLDVEPGEYELHATFDGDDDVEGATATQPFRVNREDTVLSLTAARTGSKARLTGRLTDADSGEPVTGRRVTVFDDDGVELGTATTDQAGEALLEVTITGPHRRELHARFQGDAWYSESAAKSEH